MALITRALRFIIISSILSSAYSSSINTPGSTSRRTRPPNETSQTAQVQQSLPCDGRAIVTSNRRACGFFVWDLPSAILYKWCHRLLKDRIYEGKGGYLFVRYESNSILKLLYPCSRYSPDKCMICGGSFHDHLELWWSKHLYSPYDQYLDKTYNDALTIIEEDDGRGQRRHGVSADNIGNKIIRNRVDRNSRPSRRSSSSIHSLTDPPAFNFHKRYVEDVTDLVKKIANLKSKQQVKLIKKRIKHLAKNRRHDVCSVPATDVTYVAPGTAAGFIDNELYTKRDFLVDFLTLMARQPVNEMIQLQVEEYTERRLKNSRIINRLGQQSTSN